MSVFDDLISPETVDGVRATVIGYAQAAGLSIRNWLVGGTGQQFTEMSVQVAYAFTKIVAIAVRGYVSLDTSTDPGDVDDFDANNVNLDAAPGFLTSFGANTYSTTREPATFAAGVVTFVNNGAISRSFAPYGLTFTWTANSPPTPAPTYRNTGDPSIYTNLDGTVTVPAGASIDLPVAADEVGASSSCVAGSLSLTTTMIGCSATNAAAVLGTDREAADVFRARCRQAPARISLGGPAAAYAYLAAKNLDGTPLLNALGTPVAIQRVYVLQDNATGIVDAYYASPSGAASSDDVTAANTNIEEQCFAVPDAITFTGAAAAATAIHVAGTVKIRSRPGLTTAQVQNAIVAALAAAFASFDIGGFDQVNGAGVIYTSDLEGIVRGAFRGIYDPVITTPGVSSTAVPLGHVATLTSVGGDWTVTIVP